MNIESLQTPHLNHIKPGKPETPRRLLDVIDTEGLRDELDQARSKGDPNFATAVTEMLPEILEPIRRSLWHIESDGPNATTTPLDTLKQNRETHCFGYTLVTSRILGMLGITHWIAAIDKHATPVIPLRPHGSENLYVADGMNLEYASYLGHALRRTTLPVMQREMNDANHPRGVALLDLGMLPAYNRLRHKPSAVTHGQSVGEFEKRRPHLVMSTFHVSIGERALRGTAAFHAAAKHGDYSRAANELRRIPGLYYDISADAPHEYIREVVAGLCANSEFSQAEQVINDYCQSFQRTKHPVFAELKADLLATVATAKGCANAYAGAQASYQLAASRTRLQHQVTAIRAKAAALAAAFRPQPPIMSL